MFSTPPRPTECEEVHSRRERSTSTAVPPWDACAGVYRIERLGQGPVVDADGSGGPLLSWRHPAQRFTALARESGRVNQSRLDEARPEARRLPKPPEVVRLRDSSTKRALGAWRNLRAVVLRQPLWHRPQVGLSGSKANRGDSEGE